MPGLKVWNCSSTIPSTKHTYYTVHIHMYTVCMYMHVEIHIMQDNGGCVPVHVFQCQGYLTCSFSQVLKLFSSFSNFVDVLSHHTLYLQ